MRKALRRERGTLKDQLAGNYADNWMLLAGMSQTRVQVPCVSVRTPSYCSRLLAVCRPHFLASVEACPNHMHPTTFQQLQPEAHQQKVAVHQQKSMPPPNSQRRLRIRK